MNLFANEGQINYNIETIFEHLCQMVLRICLLFIDMELSDHKLTV